MDLETVNKLLSDQTGNHATFYPILKERLNVYPCEEVSFPCEFLFFEERYLAIKKHMIENNVKQDIVDIGCQFGFQSEMFLDSDSYIGIDRYRPSYFMNSEKDNINYIVGTFPNVDIDLKEKTVISSMSLGYFNSYVNEDETQAINSLINALKEAATIYIATTKSFVDELSSHFKTKELLSESNAGDFHLYLLQK
ncbi:hypothetical protein P4571_07970 [Niallia alba]|uniref:hypothetical protein n=1 Tax=Niallia alba TaxID=2729105 RepID=UPI002E1A2D77|nr:hypothetical protein [Niallia alba]